MKGEMNVGEHWELVMLARRVAFCDPKASTELDDRSKVSVLTEFAIKVHEGRGVNV